MLFVWRRPRRKCKTQFEAVPPLDFLQLALIAGVSITKYWSTNTQIPILKYKYQHCNTNTKILILKYKNQYQNTFTEIPIPKHRHRRNITRNWIHSPTLIVFKFNTHYTLTLTFLEVIVVPADPVGMLSLSCLCRSERFLTGILNM